jgi:deoxyadenosine/deoxycytidine kinase
MPGPHDAAPFIDPWRVPDPGPPRHTKYICISGNTATGKSTLLRYIAQAVFAVQPNTIAIDEDTLHHPHLRSLFHSPERFAYEMQVNFMLQRALVARIWLESGFNVVMERSHLEDPIFIRHLLGLGYVSLQEHDTYMSLWARLSDRLRCPDALLYLDAAPSISVDRLTTAEAAGARPREFPNDAAKYQWVQSWAELYEERFRELEADPQVRGILHRVAGQAPDAVFNSIVKSVL